MAKAELWRNRIIGSAEVPPDSLLAHPSNWRGHPANQQNALTDILGGDDGVGWLDTVMVNKRTSELWPAGDRGVETVVDGHLRVALAMRHNQPTVPVRYVDLTPAEEALALATFDPIGALATAQAEQLDAVLREVQTGSEAVGEMLAGLAEGAGLYLDKGKPEDPGAQVDKADELREKWQTSAGQLWQLGEHRLICGDCTDKAVVERVMGEDRAEMVWTDPPYGVAVGDKNKWLNSIARSNRIEENLENDTIDEAGISGMLCAAFDNAVAFCVPGAAWYVAAPPGPLHLLFGQVLKDRGIWRQTIQWVKNNSTFSPMGVCYHWQAEPIFFGWLPNAGHRWYGGRTQTTVWNIDRPTKSPEHPTMKPVELVDRAVENSSKAGEVVFDGFAGSGTTLIACERLGRKCRAVEVEPKYVAVALERWSQMTGQEPVLLS